MTKIQNPKSKIQNPKCLILAAGAGTRMNTELPKPLHKIGAKTMLERLIETVRALGIKDIVVVVGHGFNLMQDFLKKYAIKIVRQKRLLGSADAVKAAEGYFKKFNGNILVLYADTPLVKTTTIKGLIDKHINSPCVCTLLTADIGRPEGYGRVIRNNSGNIAKIVEEQDATAEEKGITEINVGAYCFKKKELFDTLTDINKNPKKKEFYLTDIIKHFKESGFTINSFRGCSGEEALGINSRQDLSIAGKIINKRKIEQLMNEGVSFTDPDTAYIDERVTIAKDTIIYPSVVIDGQTTIGKNCRIGPFCTIRGDTQIGDNCAIGNFVEVVRSRIGPNSKVKHHTYLGDAVVGENVNIGAGAITANYDGRNKNKTIIKDGAFIGVGAILIAPVKIGKQAVVGAGSVVTKNKNVPDNAVVIGAPARILRKVKK